MSEPKYEHMAFLRYDGPKSDRPEIFQVALREPTQSGSWIYHGFLIEIIGNKGRDIPYTIRAKGYLDDVHEEELSPLERKANLVNIEKNPPNINLAVRVSS